MAPQWQEEDLAILRLSEQLGQKWSAIAKFLPGRTDDAVRNRYNRLKEMDANHAAGLAAATLSPTGSGGALEGGERRAAGGAEGASTGAPPSSRREPTKDREKPERISWSM